MRSSVVSLALEKRPPRDRAVVEDKIAPLLQEADWKPFRIPIVTSCKRWWGWDIRSTKPKRQWLPFRMMPLWIWKTACVLPCNISRVEWRMLECMV